MLGTEPHSLAGIVVLVTIMAIFVLLLLICREIVCWYFKINEHIQDQWKQLVVMRKILTILQEMQKNAQADRNERRLGRRLLCPECGEDITHMPQHCPKCGKELVYKEKSEPDTNAA